MSGDTVDDLALTVCCAGGLQHHRCLHTAGQPWLVNAIARETTTKMGLHPRTTITTEHIEQATRRIIATHLDSLVAKLNEPRVQRIIEPIIAGEDIHTPDAAAYDDDKTYVAHLGLDTGTLVIFDRRTTTPPLTEPGTFTHETTTDGRKVRLLRL